MTIDQRGQDISGEPQAAADSPPVTRREGFRRFLWSFSRNKLAVVSAVFIIVICLAAVFAPYLTPYPPASQNLANRLQSPSLSHILGTDAFGRDVFSRVMMGARVSLAVGFLAVAVLLVIGCAIGLLAGNSHRLDGPLMRVVDLLLAIPGLFLLLLLVALFGAGVTQTIVFIGVTNWMPMARLVRGQILSLREKEFIEAARSLGGGGRQIMLRHYLPNVMDVILVGATLTISQVILFESALSYLGLGAQPPTPTWGNMLADGKSYMRSAWWLTTFPGLAIFATVMSFNFLGDGIRDAMDSRTQADQSGN